MRTLDIKISFLLTILLGVLLYFKNPEHINVVLLITIVTFTCLIPIISLFDVKDKNKRLLIISGLSLFWILLFIAGYVKFFDLDKAILISILPVGLISLIVSYLSEKEHEEDDIEI